MSRSYTTIDVGPLSFRADLQSVDQEARTVKLVFSTGAPVDRVDWTTGKRYLEVLSLKPEHVRLERLNGGAPLLDSHSAFSVAGILGAVEPGTAGVDGREATAVVRFSKRRDAESVWQDVCDRIIRNVSVGYRVHRFEERGGADGKLPVRTAVDWEPFELSLVTMPADTGAQVRGGASGANQCLVCREADDDRARRVAVDDADRLRRLRLAKARGPAGGAA